MFHTSSSVSVAWPVIHINVTGARIYTCRRGGGGGGRGGGRGGLAPVPEYYSQIYKPVVGGGKILCSQCSKQIPWVHMSRYWAMGYMTLCMYIYIHVHVGYAICLYSVHGGLQIVHTCSWSHTTKHSFNMCCGQIHCLSTPATALVT